MPNWTLREAATCSEQVRFAGSSNERKALSNLGMVLDHFGAAKRLDDITTTDVDGFIDALKGIGNKPATINRKLAVLKALYTDAARRDGCSRTPHIPTLKVSHSRIRYLSVEEEDALINWCCNTEEINVCEALIVLMDTGMRVSELFRTIPADVDLEHNIISVWKTKADKPRSVPMTDRVRQIVARRCKRRNQNGSLFYNLHRGHLEYVWDCARGDLGMEDDNHWVLHMLRHTCASRLVQQGVDLYVVKEILGHKSITVTEQYAHLAKPQLRDAIRKLEQVNGRPAPARTRNAHARAGSS